MPSLDQIPLWAIFCAVVLLSFVCIDCGYRMAIKQSSEGDSDAQQPLTAILASTLALLAFVLAFTFNIAANRFDERRTAVINEANAIGTTYLRADFLQEPLRQRVRSNLRQYAALRVSCTSRERVEEAIPQSESLHDRLWSDATQAARQNGNSPICALFIASLNEVIDLHAKRVTLGLYSRVPPSVWLCLMIVAILSMAGVGYLCGLSGKRCVVSNSVLVGCFAVVMLLVADLDRPQQGLLRTPQQPLIDLSKKLGPP